MYGEQLQGLVYVEHTFVPLSCGDSPCAVLNVGDHDTFIKGCLQKWDSNYPMWSRLTEFLLVAFLLNRQRVFNLKS